MIPTKIVGGVALPVYGFGTWEMGGRFEHDPSNDDAADISAIRAAIDAGVRHIDTAESYAAGHAERLVTEAIRNANRSALFIVSKASAGHHTPEALLHSFNQSCERLQLDYLDAYMLHRYDASVPLDETLDAMAQLVDTGRLRHIAVSNFNVPRLMEAQKASRYPIVANQLHYNLQVREIESEGVLDYCQANDIAVIAWGPVQKGALSGNDPLVHEMCRRYDCTLMQLGIAWLIAQAGVVTLSKTRNLAHLHENIAATQLALAPDDVETLRASFPNQQSRSDRVPLDY